MRIQQEVRSMFLTWAFMSLLLLGVGMGPALAVPQIDSTESALFLHVTYTAPNLSVDAKNVSLSDLLRAIGKEAGFECRGPEQTLIVERISIREEALPKVLDQLLAGENYLIQYQQDAPTQNIVAVVLAEESARNPASMERPAFSQPGYAEPSVSRENQALVSQSLTAGGHERPSTEPEEETLKPQERSPFDSSATASSPGQPQEGPPSSSVNQPAQVPMAIQQRAMKGVQKLAESLKHKSEDLKE